MSDTLVIVQARVGSTRLPGKVLAPVGDRPMVAHVMERAAAIGPPVVLATSLEREDDPLARLAAGSGWALHRGSRDDVLDRFVGAIPPEARFVVRLTADCPLLDPLVARAVLTVLRVTGADYVSNVRPPTFPDGLDCEAMTVDALRTAGREASLAPDREHVTAFLWRQPQRFHILNLAHVPDLSTERWTVDDERDLAFVRAVDERLRDLSPEQRMSMYAVCGVLEAEPALRELNAGSVRDLGFARSQLDAGTARVTLRTPTARDRDAMVRWQRDEGLRGKGGGAEWPFASLDNPSGADVQGYVAAVGDVPIGIVMVRPRDEASVELRLYVDAYLQETAATASILDAVKRHYAARRPPRRIFARLDAADPLTLRAFENAGYRRRAAAEAATEFVLDI